MPCIVRYYICIHESSKKNPAIKHIERKFKKLGRYQDLFFHKYTDLPSFVQFLSDWSRKHLKKPSEFSFECVGFINQYCKLVQNPCLLPDPPLMYNYCPTCKGPLDYDIQNSCCRKCQGKDVQLLFDSSSPPVLCLHSNVSRIILPAQHNNMYWAETQCRDSFNFVLNPHYFSQFCKLLGVYSDIGAGVTFDDLFTTISKVTFPKRGVFSVLQYHFTEEITKYIVPDDRYFFKDTTTKMKYDILEKFYKAVDSRLSRLEFSTPNSVQLAQIKKVDEYYNKLNGSGEQYNKLPPVSIVTSITDINKFFVLLHCFYTLNYPRDLLKLYVCDQYDMNKKFAHIITNDTRVQFLSMQTKDKQHVPLGYQLNAAMKYVQTDLVTFMFDDSIYDSNYIRNSVVNLLATDKSLVFSNLAVCNRTLDSAKKWKYHSRYFDLPNLGSIVMYKYMWNFFAFIELEDDPLCLFYNFCKYRTDMCLKLPFVGRTFCFDFSQKIFKRLTDLGRDTESLLATLNPKQLEAIQVYQKCIRFKSEEDD